MSLIGGLIKGDGNHLRGCSSWLLGGKGAGNRFRALDQEAVPDILFCTRFCHRCRTLVYPKMQPAANARGAGFPCQAPVHGVPFHRSPLCAAPRADARRFAARQATGNLPRNRKTIELAARLFRLRSAEGGGQATRKRLGAAHRARVSRSDTRQAIGSPRWMPAVSARVRTVRRKYSTTHIDIPTTRG
jgi:hypothetical protein